MISYSVVHHFCRIEDDTLPSLCRLFHYRRISAQALTFPNG